MISTVIYDYKQSDNFIKSKTGIISYFSSRHNVAPLAVSIFTNIRDIGLIYHAVGNSYDLHFKRH